MLENHRAVIGTNNLFQIQTNHDLLALLASQPVEEGFFIQPFLSDMRAR
jgi:hypothetical protein